MRPLLFQVGDTLIPAYPLCYAVAMMSAAYLMERTAVDRGVPREVVLGLISVSGMTMMIGARLMYLIFYSEAHRHGVLGGGLVHFGGVVGLVVACLAWSWVKGSQVSDCLDGLAVGGAAGMVIVRIGCFAAGCCFGKPTNLPWGVCFPNFQVGGSPTGGSPAFASHLARGVTGDPAR